MATSVGKTDHNSGSMGGTSGADHNQQMIKDRIIYLNDALSGIHGSKFRHIAQDIFKSRKAIYDSQRRKWMDSQLQTYLDSKIPEYLRIKYQNTFGMYEGIHIPTEHHKNPDIWAEKNSKKNTSMSSAFGALRMLNRKLASTDKDSKRTFDDATLGKRNNFFDFE